MSDSPRSIPRLAALLLAVLPFLSGCLHYDERGTIATDGSGEVRVVYSMGPGGELDKEKQAEVRASVAATDGIEILGDVDSTDGDTTWVGMSLHFSSLAALQAIDTLLPLKGMFQGVALRQDGESWLLTRTVRLPPTPTEGMDMPRFRQILTWVVPGRIVHADTLARWSEGDNTVVWTLPNDGSVGTTADLEVKWIDGDVVRVALPWTSIGLGAGVLALLVVLLVLWRRKVAKASKPSDLSASSMSESVPASVPERAADIPLAPESSSAHAPAPGEAPVPGVSDTPVQEPAAPAMRPRRFWPRYFLSPSLFLAAFGLFALAPVVNVSCMGRTKTMTGWDLSYRSPDMSEQLGGMLDMAETMGVQPGFNEHTLTKEDVQDQAKTPRQTSDVTYFLWSILFAAGLCLIFPWERAQGLAALLFGGGLIWFQERLAYGMDHTIPEMAKFLKIERLAAWQLVEALIVLGVLSGLWSIVSSLRGTKVRKGWVPSVLVLLLFAPVALVVAQYQQPPPRSEATTDTTSVFEMPTDSASGSGEEDDPGAESEAQAPEPFLDSRDDRTYRVVNGPSGPWMGRNIAFVADSSWCFPAPGVDCEREGRLYNWEAAEQACPAGWRLPTLQEAEGLVGSVGEDAVSLLRAGPVGTEDIDPGVALVASGWGGPDGSWNDHGRTISLWVTQPGRDMGPFIWQINAGDQVSTGPASRHSRHGVRCVSEGE